MQFIIAHENDTKKYLEATFDPPFASQKWQRTVLVPALAPARGNTGRFSRSSYS